MKKALLLVIVAAVLSVSLAACSKPAPPVGKWEGGYEGGGTIVAARVEILPARPPLVLRS